MTKIVGLVGMMVQVKVKFEILKLLKSLVLTQILKQKYGNNSFC